MKEETMKRWGWVLVAAGCLAVGSTAGCTTTTADVTATPSPTGTPTATGTPWPGQLGSLSQAGADDITGANPGAVLVVDELVDESESEPAHTSLVLVDPVAHSVLKVFDLAEIGLADVAIVDLEWSSGSTEAQVVLDSRDGTEASAGTLDLLTGDLTVDQTIPDAWAVGLRSDGALVGQVFGTDGPESLVVVEDGDVREVGATALSVTVDPSGTYAVSPLDAGLASAGYRVMNLMTGATSSHEWGDGLSGFITGWAGDAELAASVSATTTTYESGFVGPTDQDGAVRLVVDVSDGSVVDRSPLAAGDLWLVGVAPLGGGQVVAAGWPVPTQAEVDTWGTDEASMMAAAEHYCRSHAYAGSWADGLAEAEIVGEWPLMALGGSGRYSYIETSAGACEGVPTLGPLEVHDSEAGTTTTVLLPDGDLSGLWLLFPMEN
jgi:hypothetical protein